MKTLQRIWEYFFAAWEITVINRGSESWSAYCPYTGTKIYGSEFNKDWVEYKYSHKFRKEEKIIKKYLN